MRPISEQEVNERFSSSINKLSWMDVGRILSRAGIRKVDLLNKLEEFELEEKFDEIFEEFLNENRIADCTACKGYYKLTKVEWEDPKVISRINIYQFLCPACQLEGAQTEPTEYHVKLETEDYSDVEMDIEAITIDDVYFQVTEEYPSTRSITIYPKNESG